MEKVKYYAIKGPDGIEAHIVRDSPILAWRKLYWQDEGCESLIEFMENRERAGYRCVRVEVAEVRRWRVSKFWFGVLCGWNLSCLIDYWMK